MITLFRTILFQNLFPTIVGISHIFEEDDVKTSVWGDCLPQSSYRYTPRRLVYNDLTSEDEEEKVFSQEDISEGFGDGKALSSGNLICHPWVGHLEIGSEPSVPLGQDIQTPFSIISKPIDSIKDSKQWKSARAVFNAFMGPPKAEDPNHVRL